MQTTILAIDDDPEFLLFLSVSLKKAYAMKTAPTIQEAQQILQAQQIDLVLLDISLGAESGLDLLQQIKSRHPNVDVVMVTGNKDPKFVVEAVKRGAADYLVKPFEPDELIAIVEKLKPYRAIREKHAALLAEINAASSQHQMLGQSAEFRAVVERARCVKGHMANVLIEGESGTGKELLARFVHQLEDQPDRPFVTVNCAAIPENLLESELFGHEKGAFTGAHQRKIGKFELATGGDIFLDEISCLKWELQAKILRALQEREICRVGGNDAIKVQVRVIAAANDHLEAQVEAGKFRRDLFHRLRVIHLQMPSLQQRVDDIPLLIAAFLHKHSPDAGKQFSPAAMEVLQHYYWPGNIRELENLVQSLVILVPHQTIQDADLPEWVYRKPSLPASNGTAAHANEFALPEHAGAIGSLRAFIENIEKAYISRALELTKNDKSKAAVLLDMSRTRLYERLKTWGLAG